MDGGDTILKEFVDTTLAKSIEIPPCQPQGLIDDVYAPSSISIDWKDESEIEAPTLTYAQALNRAHRKILEESPDSMVMGQDIADYGGPFKVTEHLYQDFGRERVVNMPICESAMVGYAMAWPLLDIAPSWNSSSPISPSMPRLKLH